MDVLQVGNKKYIKASTMARNLGYTSDYVGQLCRAGKVDAKLIGRSWYVQEDSIADHKNTRYRSTQVKTKKAIELTFSKNDQNEALQVPLRSNFYQHSRVKAPRYDIDETELIPEIDKVVRKSGHLGVTLADAASVSVVSKSPKFIFDTPVNPKIRFKGTLKLSEFDTEKSAVPEGGILVHPKEVGKIKHGKSLKNKVISSEQVLKNDIASHIHPSDQDTFSTTRISMVHDGVQDNLLKTYWFSLFLVMCSFLLLFLLFTLESQSIYTKQGSLFSSKFSITFGTEQLFDLINRLKLFL